MSTPGLFEPLYEPRAAEISPCGRYRYSLTRRWAATGPVCVFTMLNPSTADAEIDDSTIRKCIGFARAIGCVALHVVNLYAYRSTDPERLWRADDPIGPDNESYLLKAAQLARDTDGRLIVAWGTNARLERVMQVVDRLAAIMPLECLRLTKHGTPEHPLFLPKSSRPQPWPLPQNPEPTPLPTVPEAIMAGVRAAGWPGTVLPKKSIGGYRVYPVVQIDQQAWKERLASGHGPELSRSTLAIWEGWAPDLGPMPPRPALSIVGMVSDAPPKTALAALWTLSGTGSGLLVCTGRRGPTTQTLMECDLQEISVAWVPTAGEPRLMLQGRKGPVATARRIVLTRYDEEELFQWALTTGLDVTQTF